LYIKDSINPAEIRIFLAVFRFIQNSYVRQGYFTALGYLHGLYFRSVCSYSCKKYKNEYQYIHFCNDEPELLNLPSIFYLLNTPFYREFGLLKS
jgi:hypothetical protein